jgi:hypothetical protein
LLFSSEIVAFTAENLFIGEDMECGAQLATRNLQWMEGLRRWKKLIIEIK